MNCSILNFVDNSLDAFFLAANAPGNSAFNCVESRMVKLSKELSGVILKHKFGTRLDAKNLIVDKDLDKDC